MNRRGFNYRPEKWLAGSAPSGSTSISTGTTPAPRRGASFALVQSIPNPKFEVALCVTLYSQWRAGLTRPENLASDKGHKQALAFLRYLAGLCHWPWFADGHLLDSTSGEQWLIG